MKFRYKVIVATGYKDSHVFARNGQELDWIIKDLLRREINVERNVVIVVVP